MQTARTAAQVAVETDPAAGGARARGRQLRVSSLPGAVPEVRRILVKDLQGRGVPNEIVGDAALVVSELLTNALRHARPLPQGFLQVSWKVRLNRAQADEGRAIVDLEVSDGGGPSTPLPAPASTWSVTGRGLRLVRSLVHEWGVIEDSGGRTVWACLGGPSRRHLSRLTCPPRSGPTPEERAPCTGGRNRSVER